MKKTVILMIALCVFMLVLCGCAGSSADASAEGQQSSQEETTAADPEEGLEGTWQDSGSQRAVLEVSEGENGNLDAVITWGMSASETMTWEFSGTYDSKSGELKYEDRVKKHLIYGEDPDDETEETVYSGGTGMLTLAEDGVRWTDDKEDAGNGCLFVKAD